MNTKKAGLAAVGILFFILLLQNTQVVTLHIFFWKISMSRIIFIPLVLFIGFVMGFVVGKKSWDW